MLVLLFEGGFGQRGEASRSSELLDRLKCSTSEEPLIIVSFLISFYPHRTALSDLRLTRLNRVLEAFYG